MVFKDDDGCVVVHYALREVMTIRRIKQRGANLWWCVLPRQLMKRKKLTLI